MLFIVSDGSNSSERDAIKKSFDATTKLAKKCNQECKFFDTLMGDISPIIGNS